MGQSAVHLMFWCPHLKLVQHVWSHRHPVWAWSVSTDDDLHWLVIAQRVQYMSYKQWQSSLSSAPSSNVTVCHSLKLVASICDLFTCHQNYRQFHDFAVAPGWTRAFSVAGSTVWNSLPDYLRDPAVDSEQFSRDLKNSSPNIRSTALAH